MIVNDCMIQHYQCVLLPTAPAVCTDPYIEICSHLHFRVKSGLAYIRTNNFPRIWSISLSFTGLQNHKTGTGPMRCYECWTEFRIDFKDYDNHGLVMFFNRWKNLGTGPGQFIPTTICRRSRTKDQSPCSSILEIEISREYSANSMD